MELSTAKIAELTFNQIKNLTLNTANGSVKHNY